MFKLYLKFLGINLKSQMQYKSSFFMMFMGQFLVAFSGFIGIYFMFSRFSTVKGFTFGEVLLCFSAVNISFALSEIFVGGSTPFPQ